MGKGAEMRALKFEFEQNKIKMKRMKTHFQTRLTDLEECEELFEMLGTFPDVCGALKGGAAYAALQKKVPDNDIVRAIEASLDVESALTTAATNPEDFVRRTEVDLQPREETVSVADHTKMQEQLAEMRGDLNRVLAAFQSVS